TALYSTERRHGSASAIMSLAAVLVFVSRPVGWASRVLSQSASTAPTAQTLTPGGPKGILPLRRRQPVRQKGRVSEYAFASPLAVLTGGRFACGIFGSSPAVTKGRIILDFGKLRIN